MGYFGDDQRFIELTAQSTSTSNLVRLLGRAVGGNNGRLVTEEIARLGLDTSHWHKVSRGNARLDPATIFVEHGTHTTSNIKRVVLRHNLIPYVCALCGIGPEWNGKPLVLRLDHKNGTHDDHRLENLRFLCPNCDSQTDTYCGANRRTRKTKHCACGKVIQEGSTQCLSCSAKVRYQKLGQPTKIAWPAQADLLARVESTSFS